MHKSLDTSIRYLKGIGPQRAKAFARIGINTLDDLLYYFPRRYEDRSSFKHISQLEEGAPAQTIRAQVLAIKERRSFRRRGFTITEIKAGDSTGSISCVWFNQPYLKNYLKAGTTLILYGKLERYNNKLQMSAPDFEIISEDKSEDLLSVARIVPVYSLPEGITQRAFRQLVNQVLKEYSLQIQDFLPFDIRSRNKLLNLAKSLFYIHFPDSLQAQEEALHRLSFEEFFLFQLPLALRKLRKKQEEGIAHKTQGALVEEFLRSLAFTLTPAQEKVIREIAWDMQQPVQMQRLLQGDVGSGKTVVAMAAMLMAIQGGYQAALMVPTEILAKQHYANIIGWATSSAGRKSRIRAGLLTSAQNAPEKKKLLRQIKAGQIDLVIGTHALLQEGVQFKGLGLAVIDEQHKFGVAQRSLLSHKGVNPDILIMTATPIPRTLAITIYGDLDVSVINELPPGRKPVLTRQISNAQREWLYAFLKEKIDSGQQVYIVYPLIEESLALDLSGAKQMYSELKNNIFKGYNVALMHGRLKDSEQDKVMSDFKSGQVQLLIATTVLEVGIDVAGATVMVIEHAERFGLSQLHQLRGRIGRGSLESHCILVSDAATEDSRLRMQAMVNYSDGFHIAEEDLKIRGPGEFFGQRQHGLSGLRISNPLTQMQLLKHAREEALELVGRDPQLADHQHLPLKEKLLARFPEYEKLIVVG
ncbi:MAG: ATP-dependent DNA helicase RecG [Candidatus Omnitrophica bacterium]|nr:ATP-dependent DNA helicase RecG [Candidatus Omnitrophota bacterium]